jgi:tetratricopeptide (TPR) repeat protein
MSDPLHRAVTELPGALSHRGDEACDRFEAAWKAGQRPRLEDHLAAVPEAERPTLLRELLLLEIDYRRLAGEQPNVDELLARFPAVNRAWLSGVLSQAALPATPPATVSVAPPATEPEDALIGRRIGPYRIEQRLGSGGMGSVYRALREDAYRQQVAVKVIRPGLDSDDLLHRFRTERQVLAELQHPHIARLLDGGSTDDGRPYFVMEYIDGEPLDRYCDRHQLSSRERLRLLQAVCAAVQHAHERGVVHRDLKPGNVLVTADGTAKVTDFGLAKRLASDAAEASPTQTGTVLGTPSYMAPEQAGGKRAEVGAAADVYALGAILYELLTGRPPFRAETPLDTLLQVLHDEPVPPSRLHPKLPRDLETICLKCLQKHPTQRYASVTALAEDVRRFLEGEPIRARPVGAVERLWRWCRRRPGLTAAAACALLALAVAGLLARQAYLGDRERRSQQDTYEERIRNEKRQYAEERALLAAMSGDADGAAKAIGEAETLGASAGQMHLLRGQVALQQGDLEPARDHLEQAVAAMPDSVAARAMLALAYFHSGKPARFDQVCVEIDQMTPRTSEDFLFKAQVESIIGRHERALQTVDEAIHRHDSIIARSVRLEVRALYALYTDDLNVAEQALKDAEVAKAMLPGNPVVLARSVQAQLVAAGVFAAKGKSERSQAALEQAGRDAQALEPFATVPQAAVARFSYFDYVDDKEAAYAASQLCTEFRHAVMLYRRGQYEKALEIADRTVAHGHGLARVERAFILAALDNGPQRALAVFQEACAQEESRFGQLAAPLILLLLGRPADAVEGSKKIRRDSANVPPWFQGWYNRHLDYQCGTITSDELLQAAGTCRPKLCEAHFVIGLRHLAEGDRKGARAHLQKCINTRVNMYWDYMWARAFLKRLEQDPTWPPWIPLTTRVEEGDMKAEMQAFLDRIARAFDTKDIDAVTKTSLPTATVKFADGTELSVAQWKESARTSWVHVKERKSRFVVEDVKRQGAEAVVTYAEIHDSVVSDPRDGRDHQIGYRGKWRATMKKTEGGWRVSRSVEIESTVTVDGKPTAAKRPEEKSKP